MTVPHEVKGVEGGISAQQKGGVMPPFFRVAFLKSLCHPIRNFWRTPLMRLLFLLGLFFIWSGLGCAGAASGWQPFDFDGSGFVSSSGGGSIQIRDGYLPIPAGTAAREDELPNGTGAVALLCFQQSSGGRLRPHPSIAPMPGVAVTVTGKKITLAARADASGYLVLALPPGTYDFRLFGFSKKVKVETGKTALVAIRGGKRMVD